MKEFLDFDTVRNNALALAHKIYFEDNFVPDVIYASLRGGAYVANVISEYYKVALGGKKNILFAAVVAKSYTDVSNQGAVRVDGWTYPPEYLRTDDKILIADDIYDSGLTLNSLVKIIMEKGIKRENIKIAVHDYKVFSYKKALPVVPDYWCRKIPVKTPDDNRWINYNSHELVGLTKQEREEYFYKPYPELKNVLEDAFNKRQDADV